MISEIKSISVSDLGPALLLVSPVELYPDCPVVPEHTEMVPLVQMDLAGRPHYARPSAAVESEHEKSS